MSPKALQVGTPTRRLAPRFAILLSLALLIAVHHGRSIGYGLFMDDYAHFRQLQECGWSIGELAAACRLELVGGILETWSMPDITLRFFRPLAFGLMKLTYSLCGWNPGVMHVASLVWHLAVTLLLMSLLRRLGATAGLSWTVSALFAIHPAHVATVQWIAAQSELMVTAFLLSATLCYLNARERSADGRIRWILSSIAFFILALGCRENAIVFPLLVAALEISGARPGRRGRIGYLVALVAAAIIYLALRSYYLGGIALPPRPYVVPPGAPDFLPFVANKLCYYLLGEFLLVPCVPLSGLSYLTAHPAAFYGSSAVIIILLLTACIRHLRRLELLGPIWLVVSMAPVLPAFESPHHLYLPGIGWAIVIMIVLRAFGRARNARFQARRPRKALMLGCITAMAVVFSGVTFFYGLALDTAQSVEDRIVDEVVSSPSPPRNGDTLYFLNLPLIGHYVRLAVEHETGVRGLRAVVLTWSPRVLGMATPAEWTPVNERTIEVRIAGDRYFSGPIGVLVAQTSGRSRPIDPRETLRHNGVTVELIEADQRGIAALRFTFDQPLGTSAARLYWGSTVRWATPIEP